MAGPSLTNRGTRRQYSYRDLLELKVIKRLLDAGHDVTALDVGALVESVADYFRARVPTLAKAVRIRTVLPTGTVTVAGSRRTTPGRRPSPRTSPIISR